MSGRGHSPVQVPDGFWARADVTDALDRRDVGRLLHLVGQHSGASQTRVGAAVDLSQGTVSDAVRGKRQITSLEVLQRIASGLGMPRDARTRLGLASTTVTPPSQRRLSTSVPSALAPPHDGAHRLRLEHVSAHPGTADLLPGAVEREDAGRLRVPSTEPEVALDLETEAGHDVSPGTLRDDRYDVPGDECDPVKRRTFLAAAGGVAVADTVSRAPTRVVQALDVVTSDSDSGADLGVAADSLDELVSHYSQTVSLLPPTSVYDDLLAARSYAGLRLDRARRSARRRSDLVVAAGHLSNLLAVVTSYLGDHAAALIWCADAERRSREAGHPELAGWAALTRAMIWYYQGQARRSVALAGQGQQIAPVGTVAHARLAAQEMRARAMLGDADGMTQAKHRAAQAIARLPGDVATTGVFSITLDEDPPYTATSLLLVDRFAEAASVTSRIIQTVYRPETCGRGEQPSSYARTLLILGLAHAGLGRVDEAAAAGRVALDGAWLVWPTIVLARRLDQVLTRDFADAAETVDYRARYQDAVGRGAGRRPPLVAPPEDRG
jgi:predicted XRE-type DNA-binding protein